MHIFEDEKMAEEQKKTGSRISARISRRWRIRMAVVLVLAAMIPVLYPAYKSYCYEDRKESCYGAREYVGITYQLLVEKELTAGIKAEDIDYTKLVKEAFVKAYDTSVEEDLTVRDLCQEGGIIQVRIDPESHLLTISCTADGHEIYQQRN